MKLNELINLYTTEILPRKKLHTQRQQKQQLTFWSKHLGRKSISSIKPVDIIKTRSLLDVSDASKNIYVAGLRHVFSVAVKEFDVLEVNPLLKVTNLKNPRGRVRFLSENERKELLLACEESSNEYLYLIVLLALTTGARKNEILKLKWEDIDFDKNLIFLHETKNGDIRTLILVDKAKQLLFELSKEKESDYVFKGKKNKPIDIQYPFEEAVKRAGLENFRFHDLRHTCASYLAMNGASINEIAEILGHKSLNMVKRYAHLSTQHKSKVVNDMVRNIEL
jgi:integrase